MRSTFTYPSLSVLDVEMQHAFSGLLCQSEACTACHSRIQNICICSCNRWQCTPSEGTFEPMQSDVSGLLAHKMCQIKVERGFSRGQCAIVFILV